MSSLDVITFREALDKSKTCEHRHLLLGNGFSIALFPQHFSYESIFEGADIPDDSRQRRIFDTLKTQDFEYTIGRLDETKQIIQQYGGHSHTPIRKEISQDIDFLKQGLVQSIAKNHPEYQSSICETQFSSCRRFLRHFVGHRKPNGSIYTLNYDLLLYWVLMQDVDPFLDFSDGFRTPMGRVVWDKSHSASQNIHYLHGALHLRESGSETEKVRWKPSRSILDQVTNSIRRGEFPLFVTEGQHTQKLHRIARSPYLRSSYLHFRDAMRNPESCLFVFGHRLSDVDQHILDLIKDGEIRRLFIGVYGLLDGGTANDAYDVIRQGKKLAEQRGPDKKLDVEFYHAGSAKVWDS